MLARGDTESGKERLRKFAKLLGVVERVRSTFGSTILTGNRTATSMYLFPFDDENGPMKSMPQTSKESDIKDLLGGEICTMMSPGGSIVASFKTALIAKSLASHMSSKGKSQSGAIKIGALVFRVELFHGALSSLLLEGNEIDVFWLRQLASTNGANYRLRDSIHDGTTGQPEGWTSSGAYGFLVGRHRVLCDSSHVFYYFREIVVESWDHCKQTPLRVIIPFNVLLRVSNGVPWTDLDERWNDGGGEKIEMRNCREAFYVACNSSFLIHLEFEELGLDKELDKQEVEQPEVDRFDLD
ncbi:hypothetical protein Tco_1353571 [Tanacetum coccineum]